MLKGIKRTTNFINHHPLAKKHLILAYAKLFSWQIRSRIVRKLLKIPFIEETHFLAKKRLTGITGNIYTGLHEFESMSFMLHVLTNNDTFYDVGANVGAYTILASGVRKSKCLSFEPIPTTFEILKKNILLNKIEHLAKCLNYGVGSIENTSFFTKDRDTQNHVSLTPSHLDIPISVVQLDKFYPDNTPTLIKIDVEGFEYQVLKGAEKTISDTKVKAIIIELNGAGSNYEIEDLKIHTLLIQYSFSPYTYNAFKRKLIKQETFGDFNTIYIRDISFIEQRITNSLPFKVFGEKI